MRRSILILTLLTLLPSLSLEAGASTQTLDLDARLVGAATPPALTPQPLDSGVSYKITVEGNWSPWAPDQLTPSPCPAQFATQFESPSVPSGDFAGLDAEYFFSAPGPGESNHNPTRCSQLNASGSIPHGFLLFSLDAGTTFFDPTPLDPAFNPAYVYEYQVTGTGQQAAFRINDTNFDNHGVLKITVEPECATPVPVSNPSFESPAIADNSTTVSQSPGWTRSDGWSWRIYNPAGTRPFPDGDQVVGANLSGPTIAGATISQDLTTISANAEYKLTFWVIDPGGAFNKFYNDNWSAALVTSDGGILATLDSANVADPSGGMSGTYVQATLTGTSTGADAGKTLRVQFTLNNLAGGALFDLVQVEECVSNSVPTAEAGLNQSIHAGQTVFLDGTGSTDLETDTADLGYAWSFLSRPAGSTAALSDAASATPSFVADRPGDYQIELSVTDEGGLSDSDQVTVTSENVPPQAEAGPDVVAIVGSLVTLDGGASSDADSDPLSYAWTLDDAPAGSAAALADAGTRFPSITPDLPGAYDVELVVDDGFESSLPDFVTVTAITVEEFSLQKLMEINNFVADLPDSSFDKKQDRKNITNEIAKTIDKIQKGQNDSAVHFIDKLIERTDGCELRGTTDLHGGPSKHDKIVPCPDQLLPYDCLVAARDALDP